jgi:pimeloyl-ACP methyl ester carboxylesterase
LGGWINPSNFPTQKLRKLSLNPDDAPFPRIVGVDALRSVSIPGYTKDIYGSFLADLARNGNYKEMIGCSPNYSGEKPSLFVFPYDWRLSNINSSEKLSDLVNCIQQIHPGKRVNILTHSMGGLVARRYVINHPDNHNVNKLITMVAPWLGAPKAINALFTGKFLGPPFDYIYPRQIKNIVRFAEAPHQLLPSAWYFVNGGRPLAYRNSTSVNYQDYSYSQTFDFINEQFPIEPPYTNSAIFHQDEPRQDNWANDVSGIKYYHLFGQTKCDDTIGHIFIHPTILYPLPVDAGRRFSVDSTTTQGDGTVPVLSANRPSTMLAPNTIVRPYLSPDCRQDGEYEHNGILHNQSFKSEILTILNDNSLQQIVATADKPQTMNNELESFNPDDLMNYLEITGINRLDVNDENGNTNMPLGAMDKPIPGIDYEYGSSVGDDLVFPHDVKFASGKVVDVKFQASTDKISIKNIKGFGRENAVEVIKYLRGRGVFIR